MLGLKLVKLIRLKIIINIRLIIIIRLIILIILLNFYQIIWYNIINSKKKYLLYYKKYSR